MVLRRLISGALSVLAVTTSAVAQVRGTVFGTKGLPVEGATIGLWAHGEEIAKTLSNPSGRFVISGAVKVADAIVARAIGYQPFSARWAPGDSVLALRLLVMPIQLPEIEVYGTGSSCPKGDQSSARRLWNEVRGRYDLPGQSAGLAIRLSIERGIVDPPDIASVDETVVRPGNIGVHGTVRGSGYETIARRGYAVSRRDSKGNVQPDWDGSYLEWWYPALHRWQPDHFIQELFGTLQDFGLVKHGSTTAITFCSRGNRRAFISGEIVLAGDSTIAETAWAFHTPRPDEHAGGHAWYLSARRSAPGYRYLLPTQAVFWRRLQDGRRSFYRDAAVYHSWYFGPDSRIPTLPREP